VLPAPVSSALHIVGVMYRGRCVGNHVPTALQTRSWVLLQSVTWYSLLVHFLQALRGAKHIKNK